MTDDRDPGLKASEEALALLEGMMLRHHREKAKYHPTRYCAMFADPLVEQIRKIRTQIDDYIGITDFDTATRAYDEARAAEGLNGTVASDRPEPAVH